MPGVIIVGSIEWVAEFERQNGRKLRVLHIGNIANNAYNNARIQRKFGIEADVLCYDYYDVMATPEWEDGGLTTAVDRNLPNWWATNLKGMQRPSWYVQGPLRLCISYLDARNKCQLDRVWLAEHSLEAAYIARLAEAATERGELWKDPRPWSKRSRFLSALRNRNQLSARQLARRLILSIETQPHAVADTADEFKRLLVRWMESGVAGSITDLRQSLCAGSL